MNLQYAPEWIADFSAFNVYADLIESLNGSLLFSDLYDGIWCDYISHLNNGATWDLSLIQDCITLPGQALSGRVLDLCCGDGRLARYLASNGMHLVGIDQSPAQIKKAHAHSIQQSLDIDWITGDVYNLDSALPKDRYLDISIAAMSAGSLNEFSDRSALNRLAQSLYSFATNRQISEYVFPLFSEKAISEMARRFTGTIITDTFQTGSQRAVVWTSMLFDEASKTLYQPAYLCDTSQREAVHRMAFAKERIWTAPDAADIFRSHGFHCSFKEMKTVRGGGADGLEIDVLRVQVDTKS